MTESKTEIPAPTRRSWAALAFCVLVAALITAVDLGSKSWAVENLSRGRFGARSIPVCQPDSGGYIATSRVPVRPKVIVENFFELSYAENCGAAFGFLNDSTSIWKKVLFYGAAVGAVFVLMQRFRAGEGGRWFVVAVPTIIAGALGNLTDRVRLGYVVDFIRFYWRSWQYPTFNVADVAITVGVIALLVDGMLETRRIRKRIEAAKTAVAIDAAVAVDESHPHADSSAATSSGN